MRIHTDNIDEVRAAIFDAAYTLPGVYAVTTVHGSRKRKAAIVLTVSADERKGRRRRNGGNYGAGSDYAATWDEWGAIFAAIFAADPGATCRAYEDGEHFHWATGGRFADGLPAHPHDTHRWEHKGPNLTGAYHVSHCKGSKAYGKCDAITRRMADRRSFDEIRA